MKVWLVAVRLKSDPQPITFYAAAIDDEAKALDAVRERIGAAGEVTETKGDAPADWVKRQKIPPGYVGQYP